MIYYEKNPSAFFIFLSSYFHSAFGNFFLCCSEWCLFYLATIFGFIYPNYHHFNSITISVFLFAKNIWKNRQHHAFGYFTTKNPVVVANYAHVNSHRKEYYNQSLFWTFLLFCWWFVQYDYCFYVAFCQN